jgi:hypothetical protein
MTKWLQVALTLMIAISLAAAPCRNCRPQAAEQAPAGHDCCPRPAPSKDCGTGKSPSCNWQPADKATPESKVEFGALHVVQPLVQVAEGARQTEMEPILHIPETRGSPPPLFLLNATLLI